MARRALSRRRFRSDAARRGLALLFLVVPLAAVAAGTPARLVVSGNAALLPSLLPSILPSGILPSGILPSGILPTLLPTPLPSPLLTCIPLPPPVGDTCTGDVLQAVPGAVASSPPGGQGPGPGAGTPTPGASAGGAPAGTQAGTPAGAGGAFIPPPAAASAPRVQLPGLTQDQLGPGGYALLLSTGIRGGLSLSAGHVWPYLAALQAILLVGLAGWFAMRRARRRVPGS